MPIIPHYYDHGQTTHYLVVIAFLLLLFVFYYSLSLLVRHMLAKFILETRATTSIPVALSSSATMPRKAHAEDIGLDLTSTEDFVLKPRGGQHIFSTGVSVQLPRNVAGFVVPRSGLGARHGVTVVNSPGLIDPGYTGSIGVGLLNTGEAEYEVKKGMRVAQLVFVNTIDVSLDEVDNLDASAGVRGHGGLGSSGY